MMQSIDKNIYGEIKIKTKMYSYVHIVVEQRVFKNMIYDPSLIFDLCEMLDVNSMMIDINDAPLIFIDVGHKIATLKYGSYGLNYHKVAKITDDILYGCDDNVYNYDHQVQGITNKLLTCKRLYNHSENMISTINNLLITKRKRVC